jgi:hypothetical protein
MWVGRVRKRDWHGKKATIAGEGKIGALPEPHLLHSFVSSEFSSKNMEGKKGMAVCGWGQVLGRGTRERECVVSKPESHKTGMEQRDPEEEHSPWNQLTWLSV